MFYTVKELKEMNVSKEKLAELIGIKDKTFDYALPQHWLDSFAKKHETTFQYKYHMSAYEITRYSCFMLYDVPFGRIVTACKEIQEIFDTMEFK